MGISPSELKSLRNKISDLFAKNDKLDSKQSEDIAKLSAKVDELNAKIVDCELALEKAAAEAKKDPESSGNSFK